MQLRQRSAYLRENPQPDRPGLNTKIMIVHPANVVVLAGQPDHRVVVAKQSPVGQGSRAVELVGTVLIYSSRFAGLVT